MEADRTWALTYANPYLVWKAHISIPPWSGQHWGYQGHLVEFMEIRRSRGKRDL